MSTATDAADIVNALTIDVEDYFQVWALSPYIDRARWEQLPCRIERNIDRLLQLLQEHRARATFFTLGWIAERYPGVVRSIVTAGHELASHGYAHLRANEQSPAEFRADIERAKAVLEDVAGVPVRGYRAPSFSISKSNLWAFDAIVAAGYQYSSSIYPVRHDHYGMPDAPRTLHRLNNGLIEIPVTTAVVLGRNVPAGGGGYFRLLPYRVSRWLIRRVNEHERQAAIFYLHPWEIDPAQPRIAHISLKTRFRHYVNLHRTEERLKRLLSDFRWDTVTNAFSLS